MLNPIVRRELDAPTADLDETKYQNFAITDDAVIFFFGQDQVVLDNAGSKEVTVPRAELASLLDRRAGRRASHTFLFVPSEASISTPNRRLRTSHVHLE